MTGQKPAASRRSGGKSAAIDVGAALAAEATPTLPPASRPKLPTALSGIPSPGVPQVPAQAPAGIVAAGESPAPAKAVVPAIQSHGVTPGLGDLSQLVDREQPKPLRRSVEVPAEYEQLLSARLHPIIARLGTKNRRATKDILTAEIVALSMIIVERALPTLSDAELEACLAEAQRRKSERLIQRRSISLFKSLSQRLGVGAPGASQEAGSSDSE